MPLFFSCKDEKVIDIKENYKEPVSGELIFIYEDFNLVRNFPKKIIWLTISEFWNNITWSQIVSYCFCITMGIGKSIAAESDLYFIADG